MEYYSMYKKKFEGMIYVLFIDLMLIILYNCKGDFMNNRFNIKFYKSIRDIIGLPIKLIFKPTINGIENIPNKPYILVGNHKSFWDIPFVALYLKDDIHFMAKKEFFSNKITKYLFEKLGAYPIDRDNLDLNAIKTSLSLLKSGNIIGIFPEGTRNKTDDIILPFKSGITRIAKKTNSLIVPFGISGEYKHNGNLRLNYGTAIDMNDVEVEDENKYLEDKVKELILK